MSLTQDTQTGDSVMSDSERVDLEHSDGGETHPVRGEERIRERGTESERVPLRQH